MKSYKNIKVYVKSFQKKLPKIVDYFENIKPKESERLFKQTL